MALHFHCFTQIKIPSGSSTFKILTKASSNGNSNPRSYSHQPSKETNVQKRCLRCGTLYQDENNSPTACFFHGHTTGERGLFALAPPHQGIDGEWSDKSGVIVYKWNEKGSRPNTGISNWNSRWSCCAQYDKNALPCRRGWHISYDDGYTLY